MSYGDEDGDSVSMMQEVEQGISNATAQLEVIQERA
jgi:hypothetical protein